MHFATTLLFLLPTLATAQSQKPLGAKVGDNIQSWLNAAKAYLPPSITSPIQAGAAQAAAINVTPLNLDNWRLTLTPSSSSASSTGPETWMVLVSGGNKTCFGQCIGIELAWNESASAFGPDPTAPRLGYINCDTDAILCSVWAAGPPAIWHIQLPVPAIDQSKPATTIHIVPLNTTTSTAQDIIEIHYAKTFEKTPVYEGAFHPFDGWLAQYGLNVPIGYILFGFSKVPSWMFMIIVSFASRTIMYDFMFFAVELTGTWITDWFQEPENWKSARECGRACTTCSALGRCPSGK